MISVVVLVEGPCRQRDDMLVVTARSLVWLVPAVVAGAVRDVVLATPPHLGIDAVADQVGCELAETDDSHLLQAGLYRARCEEVLVLRAGHQPQGDLVGEIEIRCRERGLTRPVLLLAAAASLLERVFPNRAPVVGVLTTKQRAAAAATFTDLVRASGTADRFASRLQPIL